jgi:hypothetical protein
MVGHSYRFDEVPAAGGRGNAPGRLPMIGANMQAESSRAMAAFGRFITPAARFRSLAGAVAVLAVGAIGIHGAVAATPEPAGKAFTICSGQTYALCATARCEMYNNVAYCRCDVKHGDSISLTLSYPGGNVCDFNAAGVSNGYMVSTYSPPPSIIKPTGDQAIYTCPASTSTGTYAQCDGGVCFQSSRGQRFPGFGQALTGTEIICACPTVTADPASSKIGYQIVGPYPCQQKFFQYCSSSVANPNNGSNVYVGAPTGSGRFLTRKLLGFVPPLNSCVPSGG